MRAIRGFHSLLLTLTLAVMTSCALLPKHLIIYNQDDAQIGIEDDPTISVKQTDVRNAHPSHLTVDEVKSLLNVIQVSGWSGTLMGIFISPTPVPLLSPEEIEKFVADTVVKVMFDKTDHENDEEESH